MKFSQIKDLCNQTGLNPTDLDLDNDWLILTDDEANERVTEYIKENIEHFSSNFLSDVTGLPNKVFELLQTYDHDCSDVITEIVEATTKNWSEVAEYAMQWDSRGHFLAPYDGDEIELVGGLYAYRQN